MDDNIQDDKTYLGAGASPATPIAQAVGVIVLQRDLLQQAGESVAKESEAIADPVTTASLRAHQMKLIERQELISYKSLYDSARNRIGYGIIQDNLNLRDQGGNWIVYPTATQAMEACVAANQAIKGGGLLGGHALNSVPLRHGQCSWLVSDLEDPHNPEKYFYCRRQVQTDQPNEHLCAIHMHDYRELEQLADDDPTDTSSNEVTPEDSNPNA